MGKPCFQARHFRHVAEVIRRAKLRPNDCIAEALADLEQDFADLFRSANPKFKPGRFFEACAARTEDDMDREWQEAERGAVQ